MELQTTAHDIPPMEWGASKDSSHVLLGIRSHALSPPRSDVCRWQRYPAGSVERE